MQVTTMTLSSYEWHMAPEFHRPIIGLHDIQPQVELICGLRDEHPNLQSAVTQS
jgi:hypothetical protein